MRSLVFVSLALLFLGGYVTMAAPAELQPPLMVRPQTMPVSELKAPVAGFSADVTEGPVPLTVRFTDTSFNNPTSWSWDLNGDGRSDSQERNPVYTYTEPGIYTIRLTVTNGAGSDTFVNQGFITAAMAAPGPEAGFSASPVRGTAPLTVRFSDESRNNPTAWWWDFTNDGVTDSRERNPVWIYTGPGIYTVRLSVSSGAGKDDLLKEGIITVLEPVTTGSTLIPHTDTVPVTSLPSTRITLPLPDKPPEPPGVPWLLVIVVGAVLLAGGYLVLRGRTSRQDQGKDRDLRIELTGGIDYGADTGDDLLGALLEELEEREEDEDGRP